MVVYRVEYEYQPFTDRKYPERESSEGPGWGRIRFAVTCPECSRTRECSTQNNIVRPFVTVCECGRVLYKEKTELPVLELEGGLIQSPRREP